MSEVERLIRRNFPELKIETIEDLGEGDFCRAFLVNENLVFRFAKHEEARQSLRRENCLLPQIAPRISLKIPQPQFASLENRAEESFAAYEFLPDQALTQAEYLNLDEDARTRCAGQAARFLGELHALDPAPAEKCGVPRVDYAAKYTDLLKRFGEKLFRSLAKPDFERAVRELENYLASGAAESFQPVLLHGDLSPDHLLFDGARVTSVIDFGDLMIGDAAWDFLWIYEDYGDDFFARAIRQYDAADKTDLIGRVVQFSRLEAIGWILECFETGDPDLAEAVDHLRALEKNAGEINSAFENPPEN